MYKLIYWDRWQFFWSPKTVGIGRDWEDLSIGPTGLPKSDDLPKKIWRHPKNSIKSFLDRYRWVLSSSTKKIKMIYLHPGEKEIQDVKVFGKSKELTHHSR